MKTITKLVGAALTAGLLSTATFAANAKTSPTGISDLPVPSKIVSPTGLPMRLEGETVKVTFLLDAMGQPHHVKVLAPRDPALNESLVPAVSQWRFTPAKKDGIAVETQVILPLHLVSKT